MAAAFRRVACWAQAGELAMVAQVAAHSAARDPNAGLAADGRPAHVTRDAAAQVSLELVLSRVGAEAWTELAISLAWRLPATAAALAAGEIDLVRARILAEAVAPLPDEAATAVEAAVLPRAGDQTYAQLHAAVRRAVIAADPDGAEQRRQAAERRAKVSLYPDQDCTATLTGTRLPAAHAAAAMARLSALARAMKAAGAGGGIDLLRAHAYIGLLLGTLPLIPPPADGPPDAGPPDADEDDGSPPDRDQDPDTPPDTHPPDRDQDPDTPPDTHPPDRDQDPDTPPDTHRRDRDQDPGGSRDPQADRGGPQPGRHGGDGPREDRHGQPPGDGGCGAPRTSRQDRPRARDRDSAPTNDLREQPPGGDADGTPKPCFDGTPPPRSDLPQAGPWTDAPPLTDTDLPTDDGWHDTRLPLPPGYADWNPDHGDPLEHEHFADPGIIPAWPPAPSAVGPACTISPGRFGPASRDPACPGPADPDPGAVRPAGPGPADPGLAGPDPGGQDQARPDPAGGGGRPPGGLLDLALPWTTLTGQTDAPGTLGRIGPITAAQARQLARFGTRNHATQWRVILTAPDGTAIAVARIRRPRRRTRAGSPGSPPARPPQAGTAFAGLLPTVGRVTVVMPAASLGHDPPGPGQPVRDQASRDQASRDQRSRDRQGRDQPSQSELAGVCARITAAARRAADAARREAEADRDAPGGCAHATASPAYRPPPRIRELVIARDQTCRNPRCGQPAWKADLDHTRPYHLGGLTCGCNLGGACRTDHQLKQLPGWTLTQPEPGIFQWTTPAGRTYSTRPDPHHAG